MATIKAGRQPKIDTAALHSNAFRAAVHEILLRYARNGDYRHATSRLIELFESELP